MTRSLKCTLQQENRYCDTPRIWIAASSCSRVQPLPGLRHWQEQVLWASASPPGLPRSDKPELTEVKIGFIPLTDCAPIAVAAEMGFDKKYGIKITPSQGGFLGRHS